MLGARVATALVLVTAFLSGLFLLPAQGWAALVAGISGLAAWEWAGLARFGSGARLIYGGVTGAGCWALAQLLSRDLVPSAGEALWLAASYGIAAVFWLAAVPLWLARKWRLGEPVRAALAGWVVLLPPALALVHVRSLGPLLLLAAMALVWVADIAAYFVGRAFGRHKLAPAISPGKTWEGVAGGAVFVLAYGLAVAASGRIEVLAGLPWLPLAILLIALTAISVEGDLFESLLKRQAGVKDSSRLLPGHGGVLDRIDSLTSTLPVVGLALLWVGP